MKSLTKSKRDLLSLMFEWEIYKKKTLIVNYTEISFNDKWMEKTWLNFELSRIVQTAPHPNKSIKSMKSNVQFYFIHIYPLQLSEMDQPSHWTSLEQFCIRPTTFRQSRASNKVPIPTDCTIFHPKSRSSFHQQSR